MINHIIEEKAEKILSDAKCFSLPISVENCATYLKLSISAVKLEDSISGFLAINANNTFIGYNNSHSELRRRFTIAHELGHFVLHAQSIPFFIDKSESNSYVFNRDERSSSGEFLKEREANNFAAALLMPKSLIKTEIANSIYQENLDLLVSELSKSFKVSEQAMRIRLSHLGYFDYSNAFNN